MDEIHISAGQEFNSFAQRLPNWQGWLATFVVDVNGNYIGTDGTSKLLGNDLDLQMLIALRSKTDVIVTTGATARAENYRSSRFAPILFITRNPNSLLEIRAFKYPGPNKNLLLPKSDHVQVFLESQKYLTELGFESFLFEGGATSLSKLLAEVGQIRAVISVANLDRPVKVDPRVVLEKLLPMVGIANIEDDFIAEKNRITVWSISS